MMLLNTIFDGDECKKINQSKYHSHYSL